MATPSEKLAEFLLNFKNYKIIEALQLLKQMTYLEHIRNVWPKMGLFVKL